jgi:hypothetical protein
MSERANGTDSTPVKNADSTGQATVIPFCASPRHGESPNQAGEASFDPIQYTSICPRCGNSNVDMKRGNGSCDVCLNCWKLECANFDLQSSPRTPAISDLDSTCAVSVVNRRASDVCHWKKTGHFDADAFATGCGHLYSFDWEFEVSISQKFCMGCGKEIFIEPTAANVEAVESKSRAVHGSERPRIGIQYPYEQPVPLKPG